MQESAHVIVEVVNHGSDFNTIQHDSPIQRMNPLLPHNPDNPILPSALLQSFKISPSSQFPSFLVQKSLTASQKHSLSRNGCARLKGAR